jgi:hypothetical protein
MPTVVKNTFSQKTPPSESCPAGLSQKYLSFNIEIKNATKFKLALLE